MKHLTPSERRFAQQLDDLIHTNPFRPARIELERAALGRAYEDGPAVIHRQAEPTRAGPNSARLLEKSERLLARVTRRARDLGPPPAKDEAALRGLVLFTLYFRHEARFYSPGAAGRPRSDRDYRAVETDHARLFGAVRLAPGPGEHAAHLFACFSQLGRAFHQIYARIAGRSPPAAALRAAAWDSVFTHDMRRYRRALAPRMADITTLVTGPSGTGKELVSQAIGRSMYRPCDPATGRLADPEPAFQALHIAALSPTLVESELFGHRRGAFTGAVADRVGWLEVCPSGGAVFLDEVGEVAPEIQVKLLRVLQERAFQRIGESRPRRFEGKLIAATNRDLAAEVAAGSFREDLYYRLCADVIEVPSLATRLAADPDELDDLLPLLARRLVGPDEAPRLAGQAREFIDRRLPAGYPWPGNVRELEQCVRNVLVRGEYRPLRPRAPTPGLGALVEAGALDAEGLLDRYCAQVYAHVGSYVAAAEKLGLDRRTVKVRATRGAR